MQATKELTININPAAPPPLAVATVSLPDGQVGVAYSGQLAATGGTAPYTWSLAAGSALPSGLSLDASGAITGTPIEDVAEPFTVVVTDSQ